MIGQAKEYGAGAQTVLRKFAFLVIFIVMTLFDTTFATYSCSQYFCVYSFRSDHTLNKSAMNKMSEHFLDFVEGATGQNRFFYS